MGKGFYISKVVGIVGGVLAVGAVATIIALSVVYVQERDKNNQNEVCPTNAILTTKPTDAPVTQTTAGTATTVLTTPAPSDKPWDQYRLPTNLVPYTYHVTLWPRLTPDNETGLYIFTGTSSVEFECVEETDVILIHSNKLNYTTLVNGQLAVLDSLSPGAAPTIKSVWLQTTTQYLVIELNGNLPKGRYSLYTEFTGELADDLGGFYRSEYDDGGVKKVIATTQMQPTDARKAFPCFDEPAMKANFTIIILHDSKTIALSNSPVIESTEIEHEGHLLTRTIFEPTVKMSTYLLAFIVSEFGYVEDASGEVKIRIYARKSAIDAGQGEYAKNITGPILRHFEEYFSIPYPLPKSDQIALPDFNAGAMENWGLITYRETALLYDKEYSSNSNKERIATIIGHELAHMWFGNLVTLRWWNDLWLNEGFASFIEYEGADSAEPGWGVKDLIVLGDVHRVFAIDALASSHPLSSKEEDIQRPEQISELFDAISYSKGASVLRMLSDFLTEDVFKKGLTSYLNHFEYGNAIYLDLWDHLQMAADNSSLGIDVKSIMNTWVLQMGFPVVTFNTTSGMVSQKHFLLDPEAEVPTSELNYIWSVPIRWRINDGNQEMMWLHKESEHKPNVATTGDQWVLGNTNLVGYYRVNYDESNWVKLLNALGNNHAAIPIINRAQLIDDAFNLARAKIIPTVRALETTEYLTKERDYIPWKSAIDNLDYFYLMFDRSEVYGPMQDYVQSLVKPLYEHYKNETKDWTEVPEGHMDQYNQVNAISLACRTGLPECVELTKNLFSKWMTTGENTIHPNLRSTVYCNAIAAGGADEWNFAWEQFQKMTVATEAEKIRASLACTKQPWLLNRYLDYTLNPAFIRKQDATSTIVYIANNVIGQSLAWDFIRAHWSYIFNQYGGGSFSFSNLVNGVTERFSTEFELQQLEAFKNDNADVGFGSGSLAVEQSLERTTGNIKWLEENKHNVLTWLESKISGDGTGPWMRYRLPTDLVPNYYNVTLWPRLSSDPNTGLYIFTGQSTVSFSCVKETDLILIHSNKLNYTKLDTSRIVKLRNSDGEDDESVPTVKYTWLELKTQYLVVQLASKLTQGRTYQLYTEFTGELADDLSGFYRSEYEEDGIQKIVATSQMHPTHARKTFPCFDEPAMKAVFFITVLHPPGTVALSNGMETDIVNTTIDGVSVTMTTFEPTKKMSTYLLAIVVSDYTYIRNVQEDILIRIWARRTTVNQGQADYALNVTGPILQFFQSYYNVSYPLTKSDQIALPDFYFGAMENWGLVTYRETNLLYDPLTSSNGNKETTATIIAHELAHMWFGNLVTQYWWNEVWLNEGFATYVSYLGADHVEPEWNVKDLIVLDDIHRAFAVDALTSSHPLSSKEDSITMPEQISEQFDTIAYSKGAAVLRMVSDFLSEPVFLQGLSSYLKYFAYGSTVGDDLWKHLEMAVAANEVPLPANVSEIMNHWIYQMGYPVVTINTHTGQVSQKPFLLDPEAPEASHDWMIPIRWMKSGELPNIWWLMEKEVVNMELKSGDRWILANINVTGFYRVNYDLGNWERLIAQLNSDHKVLPLINRAQLVDDTFNLARAQLVPTTLALRTTTYLSEETEYLPWQSAITNLHYYHQMLDRTQVYQPMQDYLKKLVTPVFFHFKNLTSNWTDVPTKHTDQYNQVNIIRTACQSGVAECQHLTMSWYQQWMDSPQHNPIHPNLRSVVYCSAIAAGDEDEWEFGWSQFKSSTLASEASKLMSALACTTKTQLLDRFLSYTLNSTMIRKQDATSVITAVASNRDGTHLAWNFVQKHWEYMFTDYGVGSFSFASLISGVTQRFSTAAELQQLEEFVKDHGAAGFGSATLAVEQALERTKANIKWVQRNEQEVFQWLNSQV